MAADKHSPCTRNNMRRVLMSNLSGRGGWRAMTVLCSILSLAVAMASFTPRTAAAQGNRTKVTYTVEFRTTGALLDPNCTSTGTDVLTGQLVGFEPPAANDDNEYVGTLIRSTRITTCGTRRNAAGIDNVCSINYVGDGLADVVFTLYEGGRGGYLQYVPNRAAYAAMWPPRPVGPGQSIVTGTCDPAELAQLQSDYDQGQTAASPNGQPLEVPGFPPLSQRPTFPLTFPPAPPKSVWTLTVTARQP
jgi:hypothetical protein